MRLAEHCDVIDAESATVADLTVREAEGLLASPRIPEAALANPKTAVQVSLISAIRRVAPGTEFTPTGMKLPEDLPLEAWTRVGMLLAAMPGIDEEVSRDLDEVIKRRRWWLSIAMDDFLAQLCAGRRDLVTRLAEELDPEEHAPGPGYLRLLADLRVAIAAVEAVLAEDRETFA